MSLQTFLKILLKKSLPLNHKPLISLEVATKIHLEIQILFRHQVQVVVFLTKMTSSEHYPETNQSLTLQNRMGLIRFFRQLLKAKDKDTASLSL